MNRIHALNYRSYKSRNEEKRESIDFVLAIPEISTKIVEENTSRIKSLTGVDSISLEEIEELEAAVGCRMKSPSIEKKKEAMLGLIKLMAGDNEELAIRILVPESK